MLREVNAVLEALVIVSLLWGLALWMVVG